MKPSFAKRLAGLVIDEWPLPQSIKRRIASHPDVARAIEADRSLGRQLRESAQQVSAVGIEASIGSIDPHPASKPALRVFILAATAATILAAVTWFLRPGPETPDSSVRIAQADPIDASPDLKPLIASINASEEVAMKVSKGLENLAYQFADLGQALTSGAVLNQADTTLPLEE